MLFEERVKNYEYKLNDTDEQVIEFILHNKKDVTGMSIQDLAKSLFTVPNTITRLCKKLGYDGYSHFKSNLKEELTSDKGQLSESLYTNIQKTFELIDNEKLYKVKQFFTDSKKVLVYGVGDTASFADLISKNIRVTGKSAYFFEHPHEIMYEIEHSYGGDVLFLISLSGETRAILEAAELAKNNGLKIISLTHLVANSLQDIADVKLYCYSPKKVVNDYDVTDRTPIMIVLRELAEFLWREK